MPDSMRGFVGCVRRCWLQVIDNEQFGDSGVICAASATVEDGGSGSVKGVTRTHTLACANTCPWQEHACTHTSSCTCTRARTRKSHLRGRTHSTHTKQSHPHMRNAGEHLYSTFDDRNRQPSPHTPAVPRFSNLPSTTANAVPRRRNMCAGLHRNAPPPMALHPRVWPTVHLRHATPTGREMRESENRLRNERRSCICCPESDAGC